MRCGSLRQVGDAVVWVLEVECIDEIGHVVSSPRHCLIRLDINSFCCLPLLNECHLRRMITVFGVDTSIASERRDDVEGYAESGTNNCPASFAIRIVNPFTRGAVCSMIRADVIRPTSSLVVGNYQGSLCVLGRRNDGLGNPPLQPSTIMR